jgi:RHS repeat-associated protein
MAKTYCFWDPVEDNIVREYADNGTTIAEYTTEPDLHGNVISQRRSGEYRQFHYDGQGSTVAVTDEQENVTDSLAYSAFGEVTERNGTTVLPFQYLGQKGYYRDPLTGQYMARRRPFDAVTSRWLTVDPIPVAPWNDYLYAGNLPTDRADPSGMIVPPSRVPQTPYSPGVDIAPGPCEEAHNDYVVFYESRKGRGDWRPLFLLNVKVNGFRFDRNCRERTHRLTVTAFETIRAGSIAPGVPPIDEVHELAPRHFEDIAVASPCVEVNRITRSVIPGPGWFTEIIADCFSRCDSCGNCLPASHDAAITFGTELAPSIDVRWTFTPTDLFEDCGYHECDVDLSVRQG